MLFNPTSEERRHEQKIITEALGNNSSFRCCTWNNHCDNWSGYLSLNNGLCDYSGYPSLDLHYSHRASFFYLPMGKGYTSCCFKAASSISFTQTTESIS